jgi:hypothetical protein
MAVSITSPSTLGLIGLVDGRKACGLKPNDPTERDDDVERWILTHSKRFESDCRQPIRQAHLTHEFTGAGSTRHSLPFRNVAGIVTLERRTGFDTWESAVGGAAIRQDGSGWFIDAETSLGAGMTYRADLLIGFDEIPDDIRSLIIEAVRMSCKDSPWGGDRLGKANQSEGSSSGGDQSVSIGFTKDPHTKLWNETVARYRRFR